MSRVRGKARVGIQQQEFRRRGPTPADDYVFDQERQRSQAEWEYFFLGSRGQAFGSDAMFSRVRIMQTFRWMNSGLLALFSNPGFMPHIHCYLERPALVWTMFSADLLIGMAYLAIAITLWALMRRIRIAFSAVVLCFGIFIGACGLTHFLEVWTLWRPDYWLAAGIKSVTAFASIGTCIYLFKLRHPIVQVAEAAKLSEQRRLNLEVLTESLEKGILDRTRELERASREFRAFFELSASGAEVVDANTLRFLKVNQKLCEITGYSESELLERTFLEVTYPEDREREAANYRQMCGGSLRQWSIEKRYIKKSGDLVWAQVTGTVICDNDGAPLYSLATVQDISERKRYEDALLESENTLKTVVNSIPQLAWMTNADGYITWYNQNWYDYTGTTLEQMRGWGWKLVQRPDYVESVTKKWESHLKSGEPWEDVFPLKGKSGEWRWFLSRARATRDAKGKVLHWFGTNTDITDQRESAQRLEQAVEARDEFLSVASHELKTPLTSLGLQAHLYRRKLQKMELKSSFRKDEELFAAQVDRNVSRLTRLVEDMLDIARIRSGKVSIQLEQINVCVLLKDLLERFAQLLMESRTPVELDCPSEIHGQWDKAKVEQTLSSLLTNAMKYGEHRPVRIHVRKVGDAVRIEFADQGMGISAEAREKIFDRFERATSANEVSGLGLGLYIARQYVIAHRGKIWVESDGVGRGSTFILELPL